MACDAARLQHRRRRGLRRPRRARDQRRKIIAIAAHAIVDRRYRIDVIGMNERLLAKESPGWSAKELLDELLTCIVRIVAFDFPFSIVKASEGAIWVPSRVQKLM